MVLCQESHSVCNASSQAYNRFRVDLLVFQICPVTGQLKKSDWAHKKPAWFPAKYLCSKKSSGFAVSWIKFVVHFLVEK